MPLALAFSVHSDEFAALEPLLREIVRRVRWIHIYWLERAWQDQGLPLFMPALPRASATVQALRRPEPMAAPPKPSPVTDSVRVPRYVGIVAIGLVVLLVGALTKWSHDRKIVMHSKKTQSGVNAKKWPGGRIAGWRGEAPPELGNLFCAFPSRAGAGKPERTDAGAGKDDYPPQATKTP